ncbi:DUF3078 domain-containing protein [Rudanella lutea]|uniref:DUF3078 domain-containing protein n=1 Tax=Rudanella lutea TaxID=451374 RepID=UPI000364FBB4|nr:DUF3078 domain-containing protein [Rudanella lutea]
MKKSILAGLALLAIGTARAQETPVVTQNFGDTLKVKKDTTYWQRSFSGGANFNQASFSNWTGGGINSVALGLVISTRALYEKGRTSWDNTGDFQLGYVNQRGLSRKAADQLFLNSVLGQKIAPKWDMFASGTFNTFFAPGYQYDKLPANRTRQQISGFFAPAQLTFAWGVAYRPNDWFSLRLSPFAPRFTFVADDAVRVRAGADGIVRPDPTATAFGVVAGKSVRTEWLALQLQAALNKNITDNININARYQTYANYQTLDAIDHRLDLTVAAKINKYLSTTLGVIALFDKDFSENWQLQQTLAIGLSYNVTTFRKK